MRARKTTTTGTSRTKARAKTPNAARKANRAVGARASGPKGRRQLAAGRTTQLGQRKRRRSAGRKADARDARADRTRAPGIRVGGAKNRVAGASARAVEPAELAVELSVRVADGSDRDTKRVEIAGVVRPPRRAAPNGFPGVKDRETVAKLVARGTRPDKLARLLAAAAHPQRLVILLKLLAGEATHKLLSKATGLKAGPLYYHLRELREAGLIGPRVRDLYILTRQGRRLILAAMAMGRLCR